jgi:predicted amidohydrolase YtcJ
MTSSVIADLVIRNGSIWASPDRTALAVRSGRLTAVGSDDDVSAAIGPRTRVIDAAGRTLLPGFHDAHVHPQFGGLALLHCNLHDSLTADAIAAVIRRDAAVLEPSQWLVGSGWEITALGAALDRSWLDQLVPHNPVFLKSAGLHDAWVNTRAIEAAGWHDDVADPPDGSFGRRGDGSLSGLLHEGAVTLMERAAPAISPEHYERALILAQRHLHSLGITAWQDAWTTQDTLAAYRSLAGRGELTARVRAALWWDRSLGDDQIECFEASRASSAIGRLQATSVKIMVDGTTGNFSAAVIEPYVSHNGVTAGGCGAMFLEPESLRRAVGRLDAAGFQVHFHAIGERAVREALNAIQAARAVNGPSGQRHHIAHVCLVHPDDIPRFAELDVTANIQPFWATSNPEMELESGFLGPERNSWWYPFESLRRSGCRLAGGSDWPVSTADPLLECYVAVHRALPEDAENEDRVFLPAERLPVEAAISAFTSGGAYVNGLDRVAGALRQGAVADVVMLDGELRQSEPAALAHLKVGLTLVGGDVVYESEEFDGG